MRAAAERIGLFAVAVFIAVTIAAQLSHDASPAAGICAKEQRQGIQCEVGPKYEAQLIVVTDPMGVTLGYLVVSDGTQVVGTIPLQ